MSWTQRTTIALLCTGFIALALAGCGKTADDTNQAADSCVPRVKFGNTVYVSQGGASDAQVIKGKRLGAGTPLGCSAGDGDGAAEATVQVYEAGDRPAAEAVLVEDPYGLMIACDISSCSER